MTESAGLPLPALLSHLLVALSRDYAAAGDGLPSLPVLSNVLRVVGQHGVGYQELPSLARISTRAVRIVTHHLEKDGWLTVVAAPGRGRKVVRLTEIGNQACETGRARLELTERDWAARYGSSCVDRLRKVLADLVDQLDLELPHYPTSYGVADISMTGGNHIPAQAGPPRIPAHGQEWPVVLRDSRNSAAGLPLTALISQTLTAFTIDYDQDAETQSGGLQGVVTFFRFVGDDGMLLSSASRMADVTGSGRSTLERHELVVVERATETDRRRVVRLTPRGRRVRDRYPALVFEVERRWCDLYGADLVAELRASLQAIDDQIDSDPPDFPDTNGWLRRLPGDRGVSMIDDR